MYRRISILASLGLAVALVVIGCSDSADNQQDDELEECPRGQTRTAGGECVRDRTNPEDTGTSDADEDQNNGDDDASTESDAGGGCAGGCPPDKYCNSGECIVGQACEPGKVLGCAGDGKKRVCTDKGIGFYKENCPSEKPNCRNAECRATVCDPGETYCKGDAKTLMQCSEDGMSAEQVEICRTRCQGGGCVSGCGGTAKESYIGCGFRAADLDNLDQTNSGESANAKQFAVTVSNTTDNELTVDVTDGNGQDVTSASVLPQSLEVIDLPRNDVEDTSLSRNNFNIQAGGPVTIHQFNPKNQSNVYTNDASLLLPANALGTDYIVNGWPSLADTGAGQRQYATIIATQEGTTTVDVTTPGDVIAGDEIEALSAGESAQYELDQGQVLQLMAEQTRGNDLTGMEISADQNISVFSGHECADVPLGTPVCDHLEQQLFPTDTWGKSYVLSKFAPRGDEDDLYRIVAARDGTTINTVPPVPQTPDGEPLDGATLDAGEVKEFRFRGDLIVNADKPISVAQFMVGAYYADPDKRCNPLQGETGGCCNPRTGMTEGCMVEKTCDDPDNNSRIGDPAFLMNVGTSQYRNNYVIQTPEGYQEDWINIVAPSIAELQIDGDDLSTSGDQIGQTRWKIYRVKVDSGVHRISSKDGKKFGLYAYGYECDVSYAYPGGLDLNSASPSP